MVTYHTTNVDYYPYIHGSS